MVVKNAESSSQIPAGSPVALVINGTDDGLAVVLPATAAAAKAHSLAYGIAHQAISAGAFGEVQVFGFCTKVKYSRARTRAASTDGYGSVAAVSIGNKLLIDTVNNAVYDGGAQAASAYLPAIAAAEDLASISSQASTTSMTHTESYVTGYMKAFLRMM